jgi:hypothetical protein
MRVVAVACQGPTQETSRDHRIHGPRIPGKWCERSRSGLALEVVYVGGPWRYFWRFPTLGHRGGISLGQCKSCCMIWLPLNLFQERRCYVFFPLHAIYILHVCWRYFEAELSWSESGLVAIYLMIGLLHASFTVTLRESIVILTQAKLQLLGRPHRQTLRKRQSMDLRPPSLLSTLCPSYSAYGCIAAYDKKTIKEKILEP